MCGSLGLGSGGSFSPSGTVVGSGGNPSVRKAQCADERGRDEEENHNSVFHATRCCDDLLELMKKKNQTCLHFSSVHPPVSLC